MGFNKGRALEEAARLVSQRKLPQAIRQYQAILEHDPQDFLLRNIIGDLWVREGNIAEALREFTKLADAYAHEGFILKAIAIYKKIAKLDSRSPAPLLKLADLYTAQKLSHEANEQYAQALAVCERNSLGDEACRILQKLIARDPRNASHRLRLAEFLFRGGLRKEACQAFLEASELLLQREDIPGASAALKRAAEADPRNPRVLLARARLAVETRQYQDIESILSADPSLRSGREARNLILTAYLHSQRLDEAAALAVEACRSGPEGFEAVEQFAKHCVHAENADAALIPVERVADLLIQRGRTADLAGSLHQVLAGHPKRTASLDVIFALSNRCGDADVPPGLLADLGKAFARACEWSKAEQVFRRLTRFDPRNPAWQALLREAVQKQSGSQATEAVPQQDVAPPSFTAHLPVSAFPSQTKAVGEGGSTNSPREPLGLILSSAGPVIAEPPSTEVASAVPLGDSEGPRTAGPAVGDSGGSPLPNAAAAPLDEAVEVDFSAEWESFSAPPASIVPDVVPPTAPPAAAQQEPANQEMHDVPVMAGTDAAGSQVEFYLNSGFLADARAAIDELAQTCPDHPKIFEWRRRLDELLDRHSRAPEEWAPLTERGAVEEIPLPESDVIGPELTGASEPLIAGAQQPFSEPGAVLDDLTRDFAEALGGVAEAQSMAEHERQPPPVGAPSAFDASLEDLLSELNVGPETPSGEDSPQTHYHLGVAFHEMGLLDEAIGEFQKVVKGGASPDWTLRYLEATSRLGNCFMEKKMPEIAARWYLRALQVPALEEEITLALTYDLALAYEQSGNFKAAHEKFSEVYSINIDYRDVAEKVQSLRLKLA